MSLLRVTPAVWIAAALLTAGCRPTMYFPEKPLMGTNSGEAFAAFDVDGNGRADFFEYADASGRITRIGYDNDGDGQADEIISLDAIAPTDCRHLILILDGFGYRSVEQSYAAGHLRWCYPPSRVIAPYPTLTDLCMEDILGYLPCEAFEAEYFDRQANRRVGGKWAYIHGANQPYDDLLDYRADLFWDSLTYLYPERIFAKELGDSMRQFLMTPRKEFMAYYVSSAGISTRKGLEGQVQALLRVEQFVNQALWQSRGRLKVTILSDHGHSYTPSKRLAIEDTLQARGWRLTDTLNGPRDVVYIRFGLETYAALSTQSPGPLAADVAAIPGVELTSYLDGDAVVVLSGADERAMIRHKEGRYAYETQHGDPLKLKGILAGLTADDQGYYADADLLAATIQHIYPDALQRLWRAHHSMAEHMPDVIVSIANGYFSGSDDLAKFIDVASTHGGLNVDNSTAFIMTTLGPMPSFMRSKDIPGRIKAVSGAPFPQDTNGGQ